MKNKYLVLVNKNSIMTNFDDYEIIACNSSYANDRYLEKRTYQQFIKLQKYIADLGYTIDVESGWRSVNYQQVIFDEIEKKKGTSYAKKYVAIPGYSEHHTGLAVDFILYENGCWYPDQEMIGHPLLKLIADNAYKFGFIIRYPEGKEQITGYGYEPWHLRYIDDVELAKYLHDNNLSLEEYLEQKKLENNNLKISNR